MNDGGQEPGLSLAGVGAGFVALWSPGQADKITITDGAGRLVDEMRLPAAADRPGLLMLAHTDWTAYPESEWRQSADGLWARPVFLLSASVRSAPISPARSLRNTGTLARESR